MRAKGNVDVESTVQDEAMDRLADAAVILEPIRRPHRLGHWNSALM